MTKRCPLSKQDRRPVDQEDVGSVVEGQKVPRNFGTSQIPVLTLLHSNEKIKSPAHSPKTQVSLGYAEDIRGVHRVRGRRESRSGDANRGAS